LKPAATLRLADLRQLLRFLLAGGLAAGANFASRFAWSLVLPFGLAVIAAYATGMAVAFVLFRTAVFERSALPLGRQVRNFTLVNLLGAGLTWVVAMLLARGLFPAVGFAFHAEAVAHAIAVATPALTSWPLHRRFSFARGAA